MGVKLIILLALIVGVLYCLHLLVQDYQALTAPKLLRLLFKRDVNIQTLPNFEFLDISTLLKAPMFMRAGGDSELRVVTVSNSKFYDNTKPTVRWRRILQHDPIQCARYVYCDLGARPPYNAERRGFAFMLTLEPREEDRAAWEVFNEAYQFGKSLKSDEVETCHTQFSSCPFHASLLFKLMEYMIRNHY